MKQFATILIMILFSNSTNAQSNDYNTLWKKVEAYDTEQLPKSAIKVLKIIAKKAKNEQNTPQYIKTLFYKSKYSQILEEDALSLIVADFKSEIETSQTPVKNVLQNTLATMYWQYYQSNRYKFRNRSHTENNVDSTDFRTWDLQTLFSEIDLHYKNSLQNGLILQQEKLEDYKVILTSIENSKNYRPTLFDLLNHNALSFYQTSENSIHKPAYKFELDNPELLSDAKTFASLNITSKDSTSLQLQALKIYQDLIQFHLKDDNPEALVDLDIIRLKYVKQNATFSNKNEIYKNTLAISKTYYKNTVFASLYNYEIAELLQQEGDYKAANQICEDIIAQFPKSSAAQKSSVLSEQITKPNIYIEAERNYLIDSYGLLKINYKNINQLEFEVYKLSHSKAEEFNKTYDNSEQLKFIKTLNTPVETWVSELKNEKDFKNHTTEIIVPKLDNGEYLIVAKTKDKNTLTSAQTLQVTNIAIIEKEGLSGLNYQIINRYNGAPLSNVTATVTYRHDYNSKYKTIMLLSNKNGEISRDDHTRYYRDISIKIKHNQDIAHFRKYNSYNYNRTNLENKKNTYKGFLFTDRSIYRPGQTVYFKGIATEISPDNTTKVFANQTAKIKLKNANHEVISELTLKTNEFGSVQGEFILPKGGLTGNFQIEMVCGSNTLHTFSVEEYKRPKFETQMLPVTKTYKVNDSVTVKGTALAYAGSKITNGKVVYKVTREVQYPSWYWRYHPSFYSESQEITHGETTTNENGEFNITFKAQPDTSVDEKTLPIFTYKIEADVTDINGETRSASSIVKVGYHALTAEIIVANYIDKTKKNQEIILETKNLNGEFVSAEGVLKIYKLKAPQNTLRSRPWEAPDYQMISKEAFKNKFPNEAYTNEHLAENWTKGELVFETKFNTENSKTITLKSIKKWLSGQYIITLESKDKFGQLVKSEANTTLFSTKDKNLADHQLFNISLDKNNYKTGNSAMVTLATSAKNLTVTINVEKNHKIVNTYIIPLQNEKKTISIPVTKEDIGGFAIHYSYAYYNSFESSKITVNVPYPKSDLEIETLTFRDKLQPGTNETWSFKIKGPKGDKVTAEILASMYDTSLDQFKSHQWQFSPVATPQYYSSFYSSTNGDFSTTHFENLHRINYTNTYKTQRYDHINWFGFNFGNRHLNRRYDAISTSHMVSDDAEIVSFKEVLAESPPGLQVISGSGQPGAAAKVKIRGANSTTGDGNPLYLLDGKIISAEEFATLNPNTFASVSVLKDAASLSIYGSRGQNGVILITSNGVEDFTEVSIRKNLQETAFFFPQLQTDADGNVSFNFTSPEALTSWKLQLLAHTKTLESGVKSLQTVTQKELMVVPNFPRFFRESDTITVSSKISNLSSQTLTGDAILQLFDAVSGVIIDAELQNNNARLPFTVDAKGNTQVSWTLQIPKHIQAVEYKVIAKSGNFSDGEQNALPVLSNRMLVTETLPMWVKSNETRTFTLDKLKNNTSSTLTHHKLSLEITSNPAWYAIQALPYLMEYPYECNEQTFSRYYANALASHIANSNPRIKAVFEQWKSSDALLSNLEKNEELKSILIQETPWLRDAQSETEQKKRIALLFDLNKMTSELQSAKRKLSENQMDNGAWSWFAGGRENRFITQHIVSGFGHLKQLNVVISEDEMDMIEDAVNYLDEAFIEEYKNLKKYNSEIDLTKDHLSYSQLQYLYMRSFFSDIDKSKETQKVTDYYNNQIKKYWTSRSLYAKGLMTLISSRNGDTKTSKKILTSLKENSITNNELGMYWKANTSSWYWYQAPIETQALLIEAFAEAGTLIENKDKNTATIDNLKTWLLKHKQTNKWETTKATSEAVYALLLQGSDWLSVTEMVDVTIGGKTIDPKKLENVKTEAGTGYYKTSWNASEITPEMAEVTLSKKGNGIAWGGLYWQYFEDLDKITSAETPLKLSKKLFLKTNTDYGEQLKEITTNTALQVGDLVRVRIELKNDRPMEFVHMKDMRAAGLEPINVLSQYKWQDGLGYYESTKDAATNFFFDNLPKGVFVFEYDLRVTNKGQMSNGITTIQSMYAPEFSNHSEGLKITVE
ncbi:alpha-2-macroglobulin family protein [Lacinutrix undariae]